MKKKETDDKFKIFLSLLKCAEKNSGDIDAASYHLAVNTTSLIIFNF